MPKLKTNRGAVKRSKTASGYKRRQSNKNHILQNKSQKRKEICVVVYKLEQVIHLQLNKCCEFSRLINFLD